MTLLKNFERTVLALTVGFFLLGCQGQTQPLILDNGDMAADDSSQAIDSTLPDVAVDEHDHEHDHEHAHDDGLNFEEIILV